MHNSLIQIEKTVRFILGMIVFPAWLLWLFLKAGIRQYNFSGILNLPELRMDAYVAAFIIYLWVERCFIYLSFHIHSGKTITVLFSVFCITSLLVPYQEGNALLSSIHLLGAYGSFSLFTVFMFLSMPYQKERSIYLMVIIFSALLTIQAGEVTGPAELAYAIGSSMMLAWLSREVD